MKSNATISLFHKLMVCLLTGMVSCASFNRLASRLLGYLLPGFLIDPLTFAIVLVLVIFAFVWHFKKLSETQTNAVLVFLQDAIRFVVAFDLAMFGWFKIFHLQFWFPMEMLDVPFGEISSQWLTWMYFGRSYPMDFTIGVFQITGAFLLLFRKTNLIGVFVTIPILLNVFLIDIFYEMGLLFVHAGIMLAAATYLLLLEHDRLKGFFLNTASSIQSFTMPTGIKMILRSSIVIVPILFFLMHETADQHPDLRGKYEVSKILINDQDVSRSIDCDSVLSVVYLEVGNTAVFQFKNYQQRSMGIYDYQPTNNEFNIDWVDGKIAAQLKATIVSTGDNKMQLTGKIGENALDVTLLKVK